MPNEKKVITIKKLFGILFFIFPPLFLLFFYFFLIRFEQNPSSTSGLAYLAMPVVVGIGVIIGFVLRMLGLYLGGFIASKTKYKSVPKISSIVYIIIVAILAISTSGLSGYYLNYRKNKKIEPRVLVENKHIKKDDLKILNEFQIDNWKFIDNRNVFSSEFSTKNIDLENSKLTIKRQLKYSHWNGQKVYLCFDDANAYILKEKSENIYNIIAKHSIRNITYITNIKGFEIDFNGEKYFVLLTVLRATLQRSFLTIYSPDFEIIYQELTGRIRTIKTVTINNKDYLVTGNERFPEYVYYWE